MEWKLAMVLALLIGVVSPTDRGARIRVWAAMMAGSLAAYIYPNLWYYVALDVSVAAIILMPPKTVWQRAIGLCFVVMILLSIGYAIRDFAALHIFLSAPNSPHMLKEAHDFLGWAALAIFSLWGGHAIFGPYFNRSGNRGPVSVAEQRRVQ